MSIPLPDLDGIDECFSCGPVATPDFSVSKLCDPMKTFTTETEQGVLYDNQNPLHQSKTCVLYLAMQDKQFFAIKNSRNINMLHHEHDMYQIVGKCATIIQDIGFWTSNDEAFILLEFANGGSIAKAINYLSIDEAWKVFAHISYAIDAIHQHNLIHLDISPSNILQMKLNDEPIYKLVDFGTVTPVGDTRYFGEGAGPYLAPELLSYHKSGSDKTQMCDIWSFGAVMYEVVTQKPIPRELPDYENIRKGSYDFSYVPPEFEIIIQMLSPIPSLRPTIKDIMRIPRIQKELSQLRNIIMKSEQKKCKSLSLSSESYNRRVSFDNI